MLDVASPLLSPALREDLPLYPPLVQLIRVTAATVPGPAGVTQIAGSSVLGPTLYVAFIQQLRTDGLIPRDREPCLADDVRGEGLTPGYYLGRLAGSHTSLPVYEIADAGASGQSTSFKFAKCLTSSPNGSDQYNARLQNYQSDGQLLDTGASIWLREAQNMGRMIEDGIYGCTKTGTSGGRDVYTVADFILVVADSALGQIVSYAHLMLLNPPRCWTILTAAARVPHITRIFEVCETGGTIYDDIFRITFDPATNWEVDDDDDNGDVTVRRVLDVYEGASARTTYTWKFTFDSTDFDVVATAAGHPTINTEGYTGSFDVITNCVAGVLKVRCLTFIRGLLKTVGAERDLGSSSCP